MPSELHSALHGPFGNSENLLSPALDFGRAGLRLACDQVHREGDRLRLRLLISHQVPLDLALSFFSIPWAMVAVLRDSSSGRATAIRLMDPAENVLEAPEANFADRREAVRSTAVSGGWLNALLEVELGAAAEHPGLLVHVALHDLLSNVVHVPAGPAVLPP